MATRLPDKELNDYEDVVALSLRIQARIRRLVYLVDDPDILADMVGVAADAAAIRRIIIITRERRKGEERPGGRSRNNDRDKGGEC